MAHDDEAAPGRSGDLFGGPDEPGREDELGGDEAGAEDELGGR